MINNMWLLYQGKWTRTIFVTMTVRRIFLSTWLVCLISLILLWVASTNPLNAIVMSYRKFDPFNASSSRLPVKSLGAPSKTNRTYINNTLETNGNLSNSTAQSVFMNAQHSQAVTSASSDTLIHIAAKAMMKKMNDLVRKMPDFEVGNGTDNFTAYVSSIFAKPWKRDVNNTWLFRFFLTKETRTTVYDELMLTQKHLKKNDKSGGIGYHKTNLFPKPPYKSCSVVGSSGILLGSQCGRVIDDKDFVIRFNLAQIKGFEEDVGYKTNVTTLNPSILRRYGRLQNASDRVKFSQSKLVEQEGLVWTSSRNSDDIRRVIDTIKLVNHSKLTLVRGNMGHFKKLNTLWKKYGVNRVQTSGFYFLNCALDLCSEVHLFGYWPFHTSLEGRTVPAHYYDGVTLNQKIHKTSDEIRLLLTMHQFGMLKLHINDCSKDNRTKIMA
ncbi:alpha-N-acetylneuraminide alpha-2,8-sialyltransferase-like [Amphiura filiformis]|uniref:alpha-N-acetylneuraminide alpha-2,8-sialyltransferase-like n=1 Tax=Amphiura filiformis TaxID=82378 RepID=UPI003B220ECA